jgi:hypothetical protein
VAEEVEQKALKSDWVSKRFRCSYPNVFKELRLQVEEDVKTRNGLRPGNSPYAFSVTENGEGFSVVLEGKDVHRSVTFQLGEHSISVRDDDGNRMFEVTLAFSDEGECKLHVDNKEREFWQVRRMALEELLFRAN